jgi:hypothetical protein
MNRTDEPATEIQISALRRFGYTAEHPLTRSEASHLLTTYQHAASEPPEESLKTGHEPFHLRKMVEQAKHVAAGHGPATQQAQKELQAAIQQRQEYWIDTCRDVTKMQLAWAEIITLYREHGCRFASPTHEQVQEILDALDTALPTWDRDHTELFYRTLELNFPELVSKR